MIAGYVVLLVVVTAIGYTCRYLTDLGAWTRGAYGVIHPHMRLLQLLCRSQGNAGNLPKRQQKGLDMFEDLHV